VPRGALDYLLDAAVTQRNVAEVAVCTVLRTEMAGRFMAYRCHWWSLMEAILDADPLPVKIYY
jgi:hypothetical protein